MGSSYLPINGASTWNIDRETPDTDETGQSIYDEVDIHYDGSSGYAASHSFIFDYTIRDTATKPAFADPGTYPWQAQSVIGGNGHSPDEGGTFAGGDGLPGFDTPEPTSIGILICGLCLAAWQFRRRKG